MIARVAAGLALNTSPEHRWRRVAVPVSAAVFMMLVISATSVLVMLQREEERADQRTALLSGQLSPKDLILLLGDDVWNGEQFQVVWIESAGSAEPILPPGVARLPEPGRAIVSPALDQLASENPALGARYPDRLVVGRDGIRSGDELFAYVRVPDGRTIAGEESAIRAHGFGKPDGGGDSYPLLRFDYLPISPVVAGVLALLVLPGLLVLVVGVATASNVRDRRFEVLRWIGARGRTLITLTVIEAVISALPGLVAATIFLGLVAPFLKRVPLVGHEVVRGDLGLPWWLLVAELAVGIVITGFVAVAVTVIHRRRGTTRPSGGRAVITPLRTAPLALSLVALVLGRITQGGVAANLKLVGVVVMIIGVPLILPGVLRVIGRVLGSFGSIPTSIAGRGLEWDPVRMSRPFVGGAAVIVIALAGSGVIALARYAEAPPLPPGDTQIVSVSWLNPSPSDTDLLTDNLGTGLVAPTREGAGHEHGGHEHGSRGHGTMLLIGATCPRLADYFPGTECNPDSPLELPVEAERRLIETIAVLVPGTEIQLAPRDEVSGSGSALVLDKAPLETLEERVRLAAMQTLTVPYISSPLSFTTVENALIPWIIGGIIFSVIGLAIGCFVSLVDRLLGTRKHRRHLLNLGVSLRRLTLLEAWVFAAPYGAVTIVSLFVGFTACVLMVSPYIPVPWRGMGITLGVVIIVGLAGTLSMALFGAKSIRENPE